MIKKYIAVEGLTLKMTPPIMHHVSIKPASKLALMLGKAVYVNALEFDVSNISLGASGAPEPSPITFTVEIVKAGRPFLHRRKPSLLPRP